MIVRHFGTSSDASAFYEDRYTGGYMDEWPETKKEMVLEVLRDMDLPGAGSALDYGCGTGVFTGLLKKALPGWSVTGCDISSNALAKARAKSPECTFMDTFDMVGRQSCFDMVFSHHVLEHVLELQSVLEQMALLLKPAGVMLHVLPCGNAGSFEHAVAVMRLNGIERDRNSRFFFEDEGHLRRLTTADLAQAVERNGFRISDSYFSCQYWGALDWITDCPRSFIEEFADPARAVDANAAKKLKRVRSSLLLLKHSKEVSARGCRMLVRELLTAVCRLAFFPVARYCVHRLQRRKKKEWMDYRRSPNGSEMLAIVRRRQT